AKNYDYIFSPFIIPSNINNDVDNDNENHHHPLDLYDLFQCQFNSDYNNYIRDLKEMSKVWQIHGTIHNYPIIDKIIQHVKSYGRLNHYCLTPFMFSHKWRFIISLIRDHTIPPTTLQTQTQRIRHMSGGNIFRQSTHNNNDNEFIITAKQRNRRKSGPPNMLENTSSSSSQLTQNGSIRLSTSDESLDTLVCPHYIKEYVQYLQSLGFSSIKSQKVVSFRKNMDFDKQRSTHDHYYYY
ncbi:hypothetical protein BLA29_009980, partial [Euroglyphus maynei]